MCVVLLLLLFAAVFFSYSQSCISFQVRVVCMCVCIEWLSKKYSEHSFVRLFGWSNWIGWCVLAHLQACVNECAINTICCWIHSTFFSTSFLFICSFFFSSLLVFFRSIFERVVQCTFGGRSTRCSIRCFVCACMRTHATIRLNAIFY